MNSKTIVLLIAISIATILQGANPKYTGLSATASDGSSPLTALFDANYGGGKQMSNIDNVDVVVNLGALKDVKTVRIYWEAANAKAYKILTSSDNTNWTEQASYTNMAAGARTDNVVFGSVVNCQYIKMQGIMRQLPYGYNIWEFEVFPEYTPVLTTVNVNPSSPAITLGNTQQFSATGLDQTNYPFSLTGTTWSVVGIGGSVNSGGLFSSTAKGGFTVTALNSGVSKSATIEVLPTNSNLSYIAGVSATATASSGTATAAFDNNAGTRWESASSDPQWIKVDLGSIKSITDFVLTWETANAKDYIIEVSDDNTNWSTGVSKTNMASGSRTDRIYDQNLTGRYVRLTGIARTTGWGYSIWEFKIFGSSLIAPTINFSTTGTINKNYGDAAFTNTASANSGGTITYSSNNTSVAAVNSSTGEITLGNAGTATITATVSANGSYNSGSTTYTVVVTGIDPELSLQSSGPISKNYGDLPFTNSASTNSPGAISYSSNNTGVATVNASTGEVTIVAAGTAIITATVASSLNYNSISVNYTLNVAGTEPQLSFATSGSINKKTTDAAFTNAATSSNSAGAISYQSGNTGVATVNASTGQVTIIGVGTTIITATLAANGGYVSKSATYTLVVKYPVGSIMGTNVTLYAQGAAGGDISNPISNSAAVISYKVATMNGKSWSYVKFSGTSGINTGAAWQTQFRYWTAANAKTENNMTESKNATTKEVTGKTSNNIPSPVRISFFQDLNPGGWSETLLTDYNPAIANTPVNGDVTAPVITAIGVISTETTATVTLTGYDNSGDVYYLIEDASHNISEIVLNGTLSLTGLTVNTSYSFTVTPFDFSGNEGQSVVKQFTCGQIINVSTNSIASSVISGTDKNVTVASGGELVVDANTTLQDLNVNAGGKVTIQTGRTFITNTINLISDATGTATFLDNRTDSEVAATVQQYLTGGRNWYVSAPVSNSAVSALSTATSVVEYNEPTASWVTKSSGTLIPGKGYISATTNATGAISFEGTLNTGNQSVTLTRTPNVAKSGFNLVGNPYPSYLDWSLVSAANPDVETTMWFRTKTSGGAYTFSTYNASGNVAAANSANTTITKLIPPMQAFWVRVNANKSSTNFTMTNDMRSHADVSGNRFKVPVQIYQPLIRLEVSNGQNSDETVIYFNESANNGYDKYDSQKMSNASATIPEIYTVADNQQLVINGLNDVSDVSEIPLGFNTAQTNTFSIKATEISNFDNIQLSLLDKLTGLEADLTTDSLTFSSSAMNNTNRFSVLLKSKSLTTTTTKLSQGLVKVFVNADNNLEIQSVEGFNNYYFEIFNMTGQKLYSETYTGTNQTVKRRFEKGIYIVAFLLNGQKQVTKLTID